MKDNVVQFVPRQKQAVEQVKAVEKAQPNPLIDPNLPIGDQAALTVIKALSFYAMQGYDGGKRAREAILAMKDASSKQDELA